jgi:hypothetical protein
MRRSCQFSMLDESLRYVSKSDSRGGSFQHFV